MRTGQTQPLLLVPGANYEAVDAVLVNFLADGTPQLLLLQMTVADKHSVKVDQLHKDFGAIPDAWWWRFSDAAGGGVAPVPLLFIVAEADREVGFRTLAQLVSPGDDAGDWSKRIRQYAARLPVVGGV